MIDKLRKQAKLLEKQDSKYQIIEKILENDKCFLEMDIDTSYSILKDLNILPSDIDNVYLSLTTKDMYEK